MYSWKKWATLETLAAVLLVLLVFLALGKVKVGEHASGFYIIRPTSWLANPTEINIDLTSFYPSTLTCEINTPYGAYSSTIQPRQTVSITLKGEFPPNRYINIPLTINCGVVKDSGEITAFVFT